MVSKLASSKVCFFLPYHLKFDAFNNTTVTLDYCPVQSV